MLEPIATLSTDILAFEAVGVVSRKDYEEILEPAFEKAYTTGKKVRFLYRFGSRFEGFQPAAAWEDFRVGLKYLNLFERCAVVADQSWLRVAVSLMSSVFPVPTKVFPNGEFEDAMAWLNSGEIGLDHHLDAATGVLQVNISAPITAENFEILTHTVDTWLNTHAQLTGIVVHAKKFPGWQNLGGLIAHLTFVGNHHKKVHRVAIVADGAMAELLPELGKHFVKAEIKHFPYDQLDQAKLWAQK